MYHVSDMTRCVAADSVSLSAPCQQVLEREARTKYSGVRLHSSLSCLLHYNYQERRKTVKPPMAWYVGGGGMGACFH